MIGNEATFTGIAERFDSYFSFNLNYKEWRRI